MIAPEWALIIWRTSRPLCCSNQLLTRDEALCSSFRPWPHEIESPRTSTFTGRSEAAAGCSRCENASVEKKRKNAAIAAERQSFAGGAITFMQFEPRL